MRVMLRRRESVALRVCQAAQPTDSVGFLGSPPKRHVVNGTS
jgi:hypothetical protein